MVFAAAAIGIILLLEHGEDFRQRVSRGFAIRFWVFLILGLLLSSAGFGFGLTALGSVVYHNKLGTQGDFGAVSFAAFWRMPARTFCASAVSDVTAVAVSRTLRAISEVAAPCSSTAEAIMVAIALTSSIVEVIARIASTASLVAVWISVT